MSERGVCCGSGENRCDWQDGGESATVEGETGSENGEIVSSLELVEGGNVNLPPTSTVEARSLSSGTSALEAGQWSSEGCGCKKLWEIVRYPSTIRRVNSSVTLAPLPPVQWEAKVFLKWMNGFHICEFMWVGLEGLYVLNLVIRTLQLPASEIRDRISGWLLFSLMIYGARLCLLSFLVEDGRLLLSSPSVAAVRSELVGLLRGSRMGAVRVLHILTILWSQLIWQILFLYNDYKAATNRSTVPPLFRIRPLVTESPLEKEVIHLLKSEAYFTIFLLPVHLLIILGTFVYFTYRRNLPMMIWLNIFRSRNEQDDDNNIHPRHFATIGRPSQFVHSNALKTFPVFSWKATASTPDNDETDDQNCCAVCLARFEQTHQVRLLPCGHIFHQTCIDKWLRSSILCPLRCNVDLQKPHDGDWSQINLDIPSFILHQLRTTTTTDNP